jgi:hypothetical protein
MSDATWKVQASVKTPKGTLINLRADNPAELDQEIAAIMSRVPALLALEQQLTAAGTVAAALPLAASQPQPAQSAPQDQFNIANPWGPQPPAPGQGPIPFDPGAQAAPAYPQQAQPQQQQAQSGAPGPAPLCLHNSPAKWVAPGISKSTGNAYQGFWACALEKQFQCKMPRR